MEPHFHKFTGYLASQFWTAADRASVQSASYAGCHAAGHIVGVDCALSVNTKYALGSE